MGPSRVWTRLEQDRPLWQSLGGTRSGTLILINLEPNGNLKADPRLFAGSILQGIPDAPDDNSLRVPAGRRVHGVVDLEKQLRVVVVPVPVSGACARQTLLMALDPDRPITR